MPRLAEDSLRIEQALLDQATCTPHQVAVVDGDLTFTYDVLAARAHALATQLLRHGLAPGDRVAI